VVGGGGKSSGTRSSAVSSSSSHHYLLEQVVGKGTRTNYRAGLRKFLLWLVDNSFDDDDVSVAELDELFLDYIHVLHRTGLPLSPARHALYGMEMYMPHLRRQLVRSRQAIRGWRKLVPAVSHPPLTWELTNVIALQLAHHGHWRYGVAVLLGFDCMMRVSELLALTTDDIADDYDCRIGMEHKGMVICLRKTKTGTYKSVEVLEHQVIILLRNLLSLTKSGSRLFPSSDETFRRHFKHACMSLDLSSNIVPHSLRHGGATRYLTVKKMRLEDVLLRGRWASTSTARIYIQQGRAMLLGQQKSKLSVLGADMAPHISYLISLYMQ